MSIITQCEALSRELIDLASKAVTENREEIIGKMEALLDQRSVLLTKLLGPYSDEERIQGRNLVLLDRELTAALEKVRIGIQRDLGELEQKKVSANRYANPYAATQQIDGMFYDKRK